ncbi:uncharacterized protein LOC134819488 [Bolinopsis microptera]|uniref:uncharacterized protein LOC134819488 n=1 Tax=Bolinopsis microptera TaxID=2820187 RepID=UPI00307AF4A2
MGRIRVNKTVEKPIRREEKKPITAYRATRLWNQVVNGFKRFMPLKPHRLKLQVYEDSFKRDEGQKWLVEFIAQTGLLKPISMEKAGTLIDKFVQLGIIEEVCCSKNWLRSPTVLYKFSCESKFRVEKLRSLRYYSRTPLKGTPEVDLKLAKAEMSPVNPPLRSHTPMYVPGRENLLMYKNSPKVGFKEGSKTPPALRKLLNNNNLMCTPCKQKQNLKVDLVFSSTPKEKRTPLTRKSTPNILDNAQYDSPYARALTNIRSSQNVARRLNNKGVKRLGNKGPLRKGLVEKRGNDVIESILDEFDDLIEAIDKQNSNLVKSSK